MAGQNRSSYARPSGGANRGLVGFFRGAFILLVALTLSFGLGFFVIARMLPPGANDSSGANSGGSAVDTKTPDSSHNDHKSDKSNSSRTTHQVASRPTAHDGPEILPEGDVQKPDKLESNSGNPTSGGSDASDAAATKSTGNRADTEDAAGGGAATASVAAEAAGPKRTRRSRPTDSDTGTVQSAGSPDSAGTHVADSPPDRSASAAPTAKQGLYRVQIGVFSTREKAEEVARTAADKGITTTVRVITRDGRTLYRVQQSTHRDREKAELERQKLQDAGFDASIINPS
jgi:cell division protein FtsN